MRAIQVDTLQPGNPLVWREVDDPVCTPDEVMVDIHATALNRADLLQRMGQYPPPPGAPDILGLEMAGVITRLGSSVRGWHVGDRVCALLAGGGYAEQVAVHHRLLMPIPSRWSFEDAAGLPETFCTAFVNLFMEADLRPGEVVLVHGGASGVGTAAIQLARAAGNRIIVTAGTDEKAARCRELGADLAINYRSEDFVERARAFTDGGGVAVILDMVGGAYLPRNLELLKSGGRLVVIALLGGSQAEINLSVLMRRRLRLIGSVLRSRTLAEKITIKERFLVHFGPMLNNSTIKPVIDSVYPVAEVEQAHQRMLEYKNIGKIIVQVRTIA